jgi:hypothetical protein
MTEITITLGIVSALFILTGMYLILDAKIKDVKSDLEQLIKVIKEITQIIKMLKK